MTDDRSVEGNVHKSPGNFERTTLLRNPGYSTLLKEGSAIWKLSQNDQKKFFLHDLNSLMTGVYTPFCREGSKTKKLLKQQGKIDDHTPLGIALHDMNINEMPEESMLRQVMDKLDDSETLDQTIARYKAVTTTGESEPMDWVIGTHLEKQYRDKRELFQKIAPVFFDCITFLRKPNEETYTRFNSHRIKIKDLMDLQGGLKLEGNNIDLDGPQTVILFNIFKNAVRHQRQVRENTASAPSLVPVLVDDEGGVLVTNKSQHPLPQNFWDLSVKGEGGNTGFGMFVSKRLLAPLTNCELDGKVITQHTNGIYDISFSLLPKN